MIVTKNGDILGGGWETLVLMDNNEWTNLLQMGHVTVYNHINDIDNVCIIVYNCKMILMKSFGISPNTKSCCMLYVYM